MMRVNDVERIHPTFINLETADGISYHPEGFDAEAETPILWLLHVKS